MLTVRIHDRPPSSRIVGDARDERWGAELTHLTRREVRHLMEDAAAHIAAESHRRLGAEVHGGRRAGDLQQRDEEHEAAGGPDVAGVTASNSLVDDVGIEARQVERGDGLRRLQHEHGEELWLVTAQVRAQQADQHALVTRSCEAIRCTGKR